MMGIAAPKLGLCRQAAAAGAAFVVWGGGSRVPGQLAGSRAVGVCLQKTAASYLLFSCLPSRKIVAEYEKTIAQMIGKVPSPSRAYGAGSWLPQPFLLSHCVPAVYSPSQRMSRGQT